MNQSHGHIRPKRRLSIALYCHGGTKCQLPGLAGEALCVQAPGAFQTYAPQFPATCSSQTESLGVSNNETPRIFWHPHYTFAYANSPTQNTHSLVSVWLEASHPSLKGRLKYHLCQSIHPSIKDLTNHTD